MGIPDLFSDRPYIPGTRMSQYVQVKANKYVYAVCVNYDLTGHDICWFVEDRDMQDAYEPTLPAVIRQSYNFDDAIRGL